MNSEFLPSRLYSLDVARGLAAFSVVIWHWQHFYFEGPGVPPEIFDRSEQPFYFLLSPFYNYGGRNAVLFFFLISGFVFFWLYRRSIETRKCSPGNFVLARFSRLYPLHFATLVLVLILQRTYLHMNSEYFVYPHNDKYHLLLHLFLASHWGFEKGWSFNAPIWSVSIEIGLYAFFFVMAFVRRSGWPWVALIVALLVVGPRFGLITGRWSVPLENFMVGGLTYFAVGHYMTHRWRMKVLDTLIILAAIAVWGMMAVSDQFASVVLHKFQLLTRVVFPLTIAALVLLETTFRIPFKKLNWIGDCTYSSYLLHFPLQIVFALALGNLASSSRVFYSPLVFVSYLLCLIGLSLACYHYFEKPMQNALRRHGSRLLRI